MVSERGNRGNVFSFHSIIQGNVEKDGFEDDLIDKKERKKEKCRKRATFIFRFPDSFP